LVSAERDTRLFSKLTFGWIKDVPRIAYPLIAAGASIAYAVLFFWQGQDLAHASFQHEVVQRQLTDQWHWIRVRVVIENLGGRPLRINNGSVRLEQILPLETGILKRIEENKTLNVRNGTEIEWPLIGKPYSETRTREILSHESDAYTYDFVVPTYLQTIQIYTHFSDVSDPERIWDHASIHDLSP
jgi:hypothetical protein